jgi:ATP-binding cassette subfamily F protein 3
MANPPSPIVTVRNLHASAGNCSLFEGAELALSEISRVGLVGTNGAGKSTLLKILAGLVAPEDGQINYRNGKTIEYVPQFVPPELLRVPLLESFFRKVQECGKDIEEWSAYEMLSLLKFTEAQYDIPLGALSGGEANRAMLGRALVAQPDFLLLDEPTNHMDSESIIFFERLLQEHLRRPFCIVSHDRDLLDGATNETLIIRDKRIYHFRVPFSEATLELRAMDEAARDRRVVEEKEIARLKESSDRLRGWVKTNSNRAAALRSMVGRIEKIQDNLTFVSRGTERKLGVDSAQLRIETAMRIPELDVVTPGDDGRLLYSIEQLNLSPGDRAVILGPNGAGKTTLLKYIAEAFAQGGSDSIKFNPQITMGYYDQELKSFAPGGTLFSHVSGNTDATNDRITRELVIAGFPFNRHGDKIDVLSGGEKARLQFLTLKIKRPGLLMLDEPTNHIDVEGIENLEQELLSSSAACIFVSHDRRFVNTVANRFFLIRDGALREIGDVQPYYELLRHRELEGTSNERKTKQNSKKNKSEKSVERPPQESFDSITAEIEELESRAGAKLDEAIQRRVQELYAKLEGLI